jgi:hypothetical protein
MEIIGYGGWGGNFFFLVHRRGKAILLIRQGSQTAARNKNKTIVRNAIYFTFGLMP